MKNIQIQSIAVLIIITLFSGWYFYISEEDMSLPEVSNISNENIESEQETLESIELTKENKPNKVIALPEVDLSLEYAEKYITELSRTHEKLQDVFTGDDTADMYSQYVDILANLNTVSVRLRDAMIILEEYKNSPDELVAAHAETTLTAYSNVRVLYVRFIMAQERLLKDFTDAGVKDYMITISSLNAEINSALKQFPLLTIYIIPMISDKDARRELATHISESFDLESDATMQAGQHAFVAGAIALRSELLK